MIFLFEYQKTQRDRAQRIITTICIILNFVLCLLIPQAQTIYDNTDYAVERKTEISTIVQSAQERANALYESGENGYIADYNSQIAQVYAKAGEITVGNANTAIAEALLYSYNAVFLLIICLYTALRTAHIEQVYATVYLMSVSKLDKSSFALCKLFSVFAVTAIAGLLLCVTGIAAFILRYGASSLLSPIQSSYSFMLCPYSLTYLSALIIKTILSVFSAYVFSLTVFLLASIFKGIILPAALSVLLVGGAFLMTFTGGNNSFFSLCNIYTLCCGDGLFVRYHGINVFCSSVPYPYCAAVFLLSSISVLIPVCIAVYSHRATSGKAQKSRVMYTEKKSFPNSVFGWELHKLFKNGVIAAVAAVFILSRIAVFTSSEDVSKLIDDEIYYDYMIALQGEPNEKSAEYITSESQSLENIIYARDTVQAEYEAGKISDEDYIKYKKSYHTAQYKIAVLGRVKKAEARLNA